MVELGSLITPYSTVCDILLPRGTDEQQPWKAKMLLDSLVNFTNPVIEYYFKRKEKNFESNSSNRRMTYHGDMISILSLSVRIKII